MKEYLDDYEVKINTQYKTVAKQVKQVALPLPSNFEERIEKAFRQPNIRDPKKIGHEFKDELSLNDFKVRCENVLTKDEERSSK